MQAEEQRPVLPSVDINASEDLPRRPWVRTPGTQNLDLRAARKVMLYEVVLVEYSDL